MPADVGTQTVTILYYRAANSAIVNKRFQGIRQTGIYSGGYLSVVDDENCQISTLVCEISDGTNQVRVETAATVNIAVAVATPYVVLRWTYTGAITDYMEILAVASPAANDIVVGLCTFDGSDDLNGFTYQGVAGVNKRKTPNTMDLFLKVEETPTSELRVRIRAGRVTTFAGSVDISDQLSSTFTAPVSNSRIDLIYVTEAGVIAVVTGTAAASPSVPSYGGKMVLAEITIASTDVNIAASAIKDVRNFIAASIPVSIFGPKTTLDSLGAALIHDTVYLAPTDGFVNVKMTATNKAYIQAYTDGSNPPTTMLTRAWDTYPYSSPNTLNNGLSFQVTKGDYWKIDYAGSQGTPSGTITWQPIGIGACVKQ
jgi:hypothetical protein